MTKCDDHTATTWQPKGRQFNYLLLFHVSRRRYREILTENLANLDMDDATQPLISRSRANADEDERGSFWCCSPDCRASSGPSLIASLFAALLLLLTGGGYLFLHGGKSGGNAPTPPPPNLNLSFAGLAKNQVPRKFAEVALNLGALTPTSTPDLPKGLRLSLL